MRNRLLRRDSSPRSGAHRAAEVAGAILEENVDLNQEEMVGLSRKLGDKA